MNEPVAEAGEGSGYTPVVPTDAEALRENEDGNFEWGPEITVVCRHFSYVSRAPQSCPPSVSHHALRN